MKPILLVAAESHHNLGVRGIRRRAGRQALPVESARRAPVLWPCGPPRHRTRAVDVKAATTAVKPGKGPWLDALLRLERAIPTGL